MRLALSEGHTKLGVSLSLSPHFKTETDPVSKTMYFIVFRIPDGGQSPEALVRSAVHYRRNHVDSILPLLQFLHCAYLQEEYFVSSYIGPTRRVDV
jgi:hypothetical protein